MVEEQKKDNFKHIVRIVNIDIPGGKPVSISLTKIKGVGTNFARVLCKLAGIDAYKKTGYLEDKEIEKLNEVAKEPAKSGVPSWMFNRKKDYERSEK